MVDYNLDLFVNIVSENVKTMILPHCSSIAVSTFRTRICEIKEWHIDFFLTDPIVDEKSFVSDSQYKTIRSGFDLVTDIPVAKPNLTNVYRLDNKNGKIFLCKTSSVLAWFKENVLSIPSDVFDMFNCCLFLWKKMLFSKKCSYRRKLRNLWKKFGSIVTAKTWFP